jgi:pilus assembly protein CpaF
MSPRARSCVHEKDVREQSPMLRVTIIRQGSDEGGEVKEFLSGQITIGRVERNDLVLVNNRVSSVHARAVQAEGGGVTLIDNNSTNGTFVNGALVRGPVSIEPDDSVEIGTFTLHFEYIEVEDGGDDGLDGGLDGGEDMSEIAPAEFDGFSEEPGEFSEPDLLPELHEPQPEATPQEAFRPPSQLHRRPRPVEVAAPAAPAKQRVRTFADEPMVRPAPVAAPVAAPVPAPVPAPTAVPATGLAGAFARCVAAVAAEGELRSEARALVHARPAVEACCADLDPRQRRQWSEWIAREVAGLGALTDILADETVSEVLVQGATLIELRRDGVRARHPTRFSCAQALELALQRMIGAAPSELQPVVDGVNQLPGLGEVAVHAVGRPLVHGGPVVLLSRPQAGPRSLADLVTHGQLSSEAARVLEDAALRGANLLVCGPPGLDCSGWVAAVAASVPEACRVVAVHRGMIARALADRAIVVDGARDLSGALTSALRLRPDALVVHEVGGAEATQLCAAARRGAGSTIVSVTAASPDGAVARLSAMVSLGVAGDPAAIRAYVSGCFDFVLALRDGANGRVVAATLAEVRHAHAGELVDLFTFDE